MYVGRVCTGQGLLGPMTRAQPGKKGFPGTATGKEFAGIGSYMGSYDLRGHPGRVCVCVGVSGSSTEPYDKDPGAEEEKGPPAGH